MAEHVASAFAKPPDLGPREFLIDYAKGLIRHLHHFRAPQFPDRPRSLAGDMQLEQFAEQRAQKCEHTPRDIIEQLVLFAEWRYQQWRAESECQAKLIPLLGLIARLESEGIAADKLRKFVRDEYCEAPAQIQDWYADARRMSLRFDLMGRNLRGL